MENKTEKKWSKALEETIAGNIDYRTFILGSESAQSSYGKGSKKSHILIMSCKNEDSSFQAGIYCGDSFGFTPENKSNITVICDSSSVDNIKIFVSLNGVLTQYKSGMLDKEAYVSIYNESDSWSEALMFDARTFLPISHIFFHDIPSRMYLRNIMLSNFAKSNDLIYDLIKKHLIIL